MTTYKYKGKKYSSRFLYLIAKHPKASPQMLNFLYFSPIKRRKKSK